LEAAGAGWPLGERFGSGVLDCAERRFGGIKRAVNDPGACGQSGISFDFLPQELYHFACSPPVNFESDFLGGSSFTFLETIISKAIS